MKIYVSCSVESYKDKIIGHLVNTLTVDLFLHSVQCQNACTVDEENPNIPVVLYCSSIM